MDDQGLRMTISTHTPLAGRDIYGLYHRRYIPNFYSHAPRGARLSWPVFFPSALQISTHTPLAGRDRVHPFGI